MRRVDRAIVETAMEKGIAILPDFLDGTELEQLRGQFEQAYLDAGLGPAAPNQRLKLRGPVLLTYPAMARCFTHPRILAIVSAVTKESRPWIRQLVTNRYTAGYPGVPNHSDNNDGNPSPPFSRQAAAVFLDDISPETGALTYVPGTHRLSFSDRAPTGNRVPHPGRDRRRRLHSPGGEGRAGSVVFRVPEVWHGVNPIHRLRRYIAATYVTRAPVDPQMQSIIAREMEERTEENLAPVAEEYREYLRY